MRKLDNIINIITTKKPILFTTKRALYTEIETNKFLKLETIQDFLDKQEIKGITHIKITDEGIEVAKIERMTQAKYIKHLKEVKTKAEKEIKQDPKITPQNKMLYLARIKENFENDTHNIKTAIRACQPKPKKAS